MHTPGGIKGGLCVSAGVCRGGAQVQSHHSVLQERSSRSSPPCAHLHVPGIRSPSSW
ncbi:hypothetical protein ONE63_004646 [Megalurothrips usitatus]|uniref:Uncharacterized protein n=1 Tax=Megalurothrips usitatus TaxID=439358 RepID=A0AAV7X3M8_9NEOP|nr:hypothetical protein ONE63_004646 [Megalurothrips usitatus]